MKIITATLVVPLLAAADSGSHVFHPPRISYHHLMSGDESAKLTFVDALTTTGIISVTKIPNMDSKDAAMAALHECALESKATEVRTFPDGTQRLTIATHSLPGYMGTVDHMTPFEPCESFNQAAAAFRPTVTAVTQAFADRIAELFVVDEHKEDNVPLLSTLTNFGFSTIADVVHHGEHLEHFRSYQKLEQLQETEETIELHVDQGLFLVFSPGRMYQGKGKAEISSGFFIQDQDDAVVEVAFDDEDDLVFMIGDGFDQYVNNRLSKKLRPVPHSLTLATHGDMETRAWYGRMVLPPFDAVHPSHSLTFGELREKMISSSNNDKEGEKFQMGCSGGMMARDLGSITCEGDSIYCWHGCMNASDFGVSAEECSSQGLELLCINPRLQISDGDSHGDYYPACADPDVQEEDSPFPRLPEYPRAETTCTQENYEAYVNQHEYDHTIELNANATFMYTLEDDHGVNGRLVYNGLFGWIAFGFANPTGDLNGMLGATIIMALPGGNYTAFSGLDLSLDPTIEEYIIDPENTAFRHWMTPVTATSKRQLHEAGPASYEVDSTDCFTSLFFEMSSIHNTKFNLDGSDDLIWAANGEDYYVAYHGNSRGRFTIDWPTGAVTGAAKELSAPAASTSAVVSFSSLAIMIIMVTLTSGFLG
jgi:hypothetical protein